MKLRISLEKNKVATAEFNEYKTTYGELLEQLSEHTSFYVSNMSLLAGHPPMPLEFPDGTLLSDMHLDEDMILYVAEKHIRGGKSSTSPRSSPILIQTHCQGCSCRSSTSNTSSPSAHKDTSPTNSLSLSALFHQQNSSESLHSGSSKLSNQPPTVRTSDEDGYLIERKVPGDNSCLFRCILRAIGCQDLTVDNLRSIVSKRIGEDPEAYSEAVLEMPPEEYCSWILQSSSWGGGIEMAVLSTEFHVEICSIDINNLRIDRFGEGRYCRRIIVLYDGSHYNYVAKVSSPETPEEFDETLFEVGFGFGSDHLLLESAIELACILRSDEPYALALLN
ncbi:ubiquitin-specific protease otu1 [Coemansia asiatica]|uniref:Ubiquitin thioesterase OTU n=1 Tax=Coemansia asiatica TaxID=1052880 RepID=A0A9W8CM06_9FUNG|nr:ubiquitin-specific protease otu1 [Coemansia asiatica]